MEWLVLRVQTSTQQKLLFLGSPSVSVCLMLNCCPLSVTPHTHRYDIKGCEVSRWVEPAPEGSPLVLVLKDLNFQGKTIDLGEPWRQSVPSFPPFRVK